MEVGKHGACLDKRNSYRASMKYLKELHDWEVLNVDWKIILKWILNKI
jgi:hypothetical protein